MSVRARLLAVTALTLAAGMSVLCLAGNVLFAHSVDRDQRQRLNARLTAVTASLSLDARGRIRVNRTVNDSELDSYAWITGPDGRLIEGPANPSRELSRLARLLARAPRAASRPGPDGTLLGSRPLRVGGRRVATVVAGVSVAQLQTLRREVLIGSIAVALLTLSVGALAIRRALAAALAPVERMTRDAEEWGAHDLERRFDLGGGRDEITALAATLDHLLQRIAASRRHEQRFAAEVAHELRTPLAAIRGVAELAAASAELPEALAGLSEIEDHSRRIAATLDTLVALARRDAPGLSQDVDLEAVVTELGVDRHLIDGPVPRVEGDPAVIRQTLAPLIDNARRHAAGRVWIELAVVRDEVTMAVRDDGPGVDPELGTSIFQPGVRGATEPDDGAGLGLSLAQRLAHSCGGEITLGEGPGGCFVVSLPVLGTGGVAHRRRRPDRSRDPRPATRLDDPQTDGPAGTAATV